MKAQERQWGPVLDPPFSAVGGPARAPKAQITSHIMRGLAQQALPLFLSLSLTHTDRQTHCSIIAEVLICSVLLSSYYTDICQHSCFTYHCMAKGTKGNKHKPCVCVFDNVRVWHLLLTLNPHLCGRTVNCLFCFNFGPQSR